MNRKTKTILIGLFVGLCIAGLCLACLWGVDKVLPELSIFLRVNPIGPDEFPDTDIVFQLHTLWGEGPDHTLGFINADGSGLTYLTLEVFRKGHFGGPWAPSYPIMTGDNSTLIFRAKTMSLHPGDIFVIRASHKAVECVDAFGESVLRPSLTADQSQIIFSLDPKPNRLAVLDLDTCHLETTTPTIYDNGAIGYEHIIQGAVSPDGRLLAFVVEEWPNQWPDVPDKVYILDLETGEEVYIGEGLGPAWSPDGQWLAYVGADGIYMVRPDGTDKGLVVAYLNPEGGGSNAAEGEWPPLPSWSPDGEWLVYHKCTVPIENTASCTNSEDYTIFIVNLATGEETLLIEGGLNPYWRWP